MGVIDLDAKVHALVERGATRKEMFRELDDIAKAAEKRGDKATVGRVGRLLFFLHHRMPADGATDADRLLYDLLKKCPE